ncbi:cupin domain-containing protein [Geodermatophilus siccatus]|uniref:cupin domain-containing protein n=1 Tax=Geodermatophilus siccatus TaxID=1137991 RepID=UPI001FDF4AE8|nr:cupin domain-containing protein [Geodermatophilus siccatus]
MTKRLVEIDDTDLEAARVALSTSTTEQTVGRALREAAASVGRRREVVWLPGGSPPTDQGSDERGGTVQPQVRHSDEVEPQVWDDPVRGEVSFRVLFSADRTPTSALYTGLTEVAPGGRLGLHRHGQAEVYHLVEGSGVVVLDGVEHPVTAGSAVFVPGNAEHGIRNTGEGPLRFVYAFATDSVDDVVYRFSDEG